MQLIINCDYQHFSRSSDYCSFYVQSMRFVCFLVQIIDCRNVVIALQHFLSTLVTNEGFFQFI